MVQISNHAGINQDELVLVCRADLAAMKRLVAATPQDKLFDLTAGERRLSVALLKNGCVALLPISAGDLLE